MMYELLSAASSTQDLNMTHNLTTMKDGLFLNAVRKTHLHSFVSLIHILLLSLLVCEECLRAEAGRQICIRRFVFFFIAIANPVSFVLVASFLAPFLMG